MYENHVLIVDDDYALTEAIALRCRALGLHVRTSPDPVHAACEICWTQPRLLIMDVGMPGTDGLTLCERLKRDGYLDATRVVVLTGRSDDATLEMCRRLGVHYLRKGDDTWAALRQHVDETIRDVRAVQNASPADGVYDGEFQRNTPPAARRPPTVLAIDDDIGITTALRLRLRERGVAVLCASNATDGIALALKEEPHVIITDFRMPDGYGDYLLHRLRSHTLTRQTPIIVLSGQGTGPDGGYGRGLEREMLRYGASAYLPKPLNFERLCELLSAYIPLSDRTAEAPRELATAS